MANNNQPDYLESLFKGIDIIVNERLNNVSFDTTIICTITDASNNKNGEYRVTDGSVSYKAYSDLDSYVAGEQVRVSVPMGDFSQKKFIVGKYVVDNDSAPITYVSPLNSVVNMSGNLVPLNKTASIKANGSEKSCIIWNQRMDADSYADLQANGIYNTIILKADFKTLLSNYDLVAGTYGLRLDLLVRPSVNSTGRIRRYIELSSKEMFGNPYSFSIFSTQAKTFSITTIGIVEGIELSLYQNGDFKDRKKGPITPNAFTDDIFVNNIELGFGSDIVNVDHNIVKIYSEDDLRYKYHNPTDSSNLKRIGLLWYNKDDHNNYIGFSDGIYTPEYDELEYLEKSRMDTRLLAQKGREGIPTDKDSLNLAANIEEATPLIQKARDIINQDLYRALLEFRQQVIKIPDLTDEINKLTSSAGEKYLLNYANAISTALSDSGEDKCGLVQQYAKVLDFARDTQEGLDEEHHSKWNDALWFPTVPYYQVIENNFKNVRDAILGDAGLFKSLESKICGDSAPYGGYKGIYDVYVVRIKRILNTMDEYLGVAKDADGNSSLTNKNFPKSVTNGTDYNLLKSYQTKTEFKTYKEQDLSAYDNKYCIYWYRYEKDYKNTDVEALMPDGWRRLTSHDFYRVVTLDAATYVANKYYTYNETTKQYELAENEFNANVKYYEKTTDDADFINVGLPSQYFDTNNQPVKNKEGKPVHAKKCAPGKGMFSRFMQNDLEHERYIAVVFYNHNMYQSNELVFTNSEVIPDKTTLDKGDILIFEHLENSKDSFQIYSELNYLMDAADEQRARGLRCHYDGLLAKDEALVGAGIYWYIPTNATMLTYDKEYLTNRGFQTDANLAEGSKPAYSKDGYVCFYKQIAARKMCSGCNRLISECNCATQTSDSYWDYTNGTENDNRDFWYKVKPRYEESASQNSIICQVRIAEDSDAIIGEQLFTFGIAGTNGTKYTLDILNTSTQVAVTKTNGLALDVALRNANDENIALNRAAAVAGSKVGDTHSCSANWLFHRYGSANEPSLQLMPLDGNAVNGLQISADNYGIVELKASFKMPDGPVPEGDETSQKSRDVNLDCLHAVAWAAGDYYISGPTTIVYNNYGTLDNTSMYDVPYSLYWGKDIPEQNIKAHSKVDVTWDIEYYIKDNSGKFNVLQDVAITATSSADDIKQHNNYVLYRRYMPVINSSGGLTPSTLYLNDLDCYAVVMAKDASGAILFEQPIIIVQNRYASTMLNSWDGGLTIDEKNGTIMTTMIGAGRKSVNNTFEGVLMGDVAIGTDSTIGFENKNNIGFSNMKSLGIYGFHDGVQSFGFNVDGTAFLGKAGAGRILFSGDYGVIASSNWFTGAPELGTTDDPYRAGGIVGSTGITRASTAGMCIDLQNGHIDAYDFKITSSTLHFNSDPRDIPEQGVVGYYMRIGNDGKTRVDYAQGYSWMTNEDYAKLATPGLLALDSHGNLTIRVNSLYLTEQLGGANLLHHTAPKQTIPVQRTDENGNLIYADDGSPVYHDAYGNIDYVYDVRKWKRAASVNVDGAQNVGPANDKKDRVVQVKNSDYTIYQTFTKLTSEKKYTISGWVRGDVEKSGAQLEIQVHNVYLDSSDNEVLVDNYNADGTSAEGGVTVADTSVTNTNLGTYSFNNVNWTYFEYTVRVPAGYSKLRVTFIGNCDYSLWHAKAEEGSIATTWCPSEDDSDENVNNVKDNYDMYLAQDAIFNKLTKDPITGQSMVGIWMLPAEESASGRKELYINATYIATGVLRSSNCDIEFKKGSDGKPELKPVLKADGSPATNNKGLPLYTYEISKLPTTGVYFNLDTGKLWAATFELTAGQGNNTLYFNSDPGASGTYFEVGNNSSYISFSGGGSLSIAASNFDLTAGATGKQIIIDSAAETYPLQIADNFKVDWDGLLTASGGTFTGIVNATGGNFSGTVTVTGEFSGGTIKGATIKGGTLDIGEGASEGAVGTAPFHVNVDGSFVATSGTIGGWTVTKGEGFSNGKVYVNPTGLGYGKNFSVDKDGNLLATSAVFDTSLTVKAKRGGDDVLSVTNTGNITMAGTIAIKGSYIYLNDKGTTAGCYLYTSGDAFYIKNSSYIYLDGDHIKVGNENAGIGIGGNAAAPAGWTIIYGSVQVNSPDEFWLVNADNQTMVTLATYIKNIGDFDTTTVTANAYFLVTGDGKKTKYSVGSSTSPVYFSEGIPVECDTFYAPTTKGSIVGSVWSSSGSGEDATPSWRTMKELLNPPMGSNYFLCTELQGATSQGGNVSLNWVSAYPPSTKGDTNQVWCGGGGGSPSWQTLNASLVNFSNTTVALTDGDSGVYTVSIPYTKVTSSSTTAYTSGHNVAVYANKALPEGYVIGGFENKGKDWVKVGTVWASGEAYTKTTTSSSTANVSGQVQVNVSTS